MQRLCSSGMVGSSGLVLTQTAMLVARRATAQRIRIANRVTVEAFHAKRFWLPTRLETAAPELAQEWDFDKNPMHVYPKIVGVASLIRAWWKCKTCGHSFAASIERRSLRGYGCPACNAHDGSALAPTSPTATAKKKQRRSRDVDKKPLPTAVLRGEQDPALRRKRRPQFSQRTKY